jgi:hypothetical protein
MASSKIRILLIIADDNCHVNVSHSCQGQLTDAALAQVLPT